MTQINEKEHEDILDQILIEGHYTWIDGYHLSSALSVAQHKISQVILQNLEKGDDKTVESYEQLSAEFYELYWPALRRFYAGEMSTINPLPENWSDGYESNRSGETDL